MPFRVPSADPGRVIFLICCILLASLGPLYVWWSNRDLPRSPASGSPRDPSEELLVLRAENRLLLSMLGAVQGRVIILGPTAAGAQASGKIAWDEARQAGFIHITALSPAPPGFTYHLAAQTRSGERISCGLLQPSPDGNIASPFNPESRLLGASTFEVVLSPPPNNRQPEQILLRGGGGE
ncbi:MAG: anti-sigma factor [Verrucomicrobiia bacterium]